MCLISTEIEFVSNTNILVAPNNNNTRQLIIYSNIVNNISGNSNAMVLPVPLPQTLEFINLSKYPEIFEDCAKCFYNTKMSDTYSLNFSNSFNTRDDKPLQVFNVGSYKVSVAMNLEQIKRADKKIFNLSDELSQVLQMFYYQPYWGFIICKLNSGTETYHPLAYSHQIIDSKIYIPTRHYHQEVEWSDINQWALGTHLDPKENPINLKKWNSDNIDQSPMFKMENFGPTAPEANKWNNMVESLDGLNYIGNNFSSNLFNTPTGKFNTNLFDTKDYSNVYRHGTKISNATSSNNMVKMSSRFDNLKKLNDPEYRKNLKTNNNQLGNYKNIADDWSHSIYLLNLNFNSNPKILQMNSCSEKWDRQTLFDPDKIDFDFGYCKSFDKIKINGTHPNIDLVIPIST